MKKDYNELIERLGNDNEDVVIGSLTELVCIKKEIISALLSLMQNTNSHKVRDKVALTIVDNFRDDKIIPTIIELIKKPELIEHNAKLVYACGEYSDCRNFVEFFVDFVLNYDYHVAWNATNIILNMQCNFDENTVSRILQKIRTEKNSIDENKLDFVDDLISFFEKLV